jgi:hypothetical protein
MSASNIPADVRRFLLAVIESVPHLEALLLLRADPLASWSPDAMAARLYIDESSASRLLTDRLAGVYARHVVEVAELIHSTSDRKAQRFADAFRWRKET